MSGHTNISLGLRQNLKQFTLLVIINSLVGALVGFYALIPLIGQREFGLVSNIIILSYIFGFGITKAFCNYYSGRLADNIGRRKVLLLGWLIGIPVPILVIIAPSWWWIVFANVLLGVNQGFAWSMTVVMKIDLVGPSQRGLATGFNEFAGYLSMSMTVLASGYLASVYSLRPVPFYLGIAFAVIGTVLSFLFVKETRKHALLEAEQRRMVIASSEKRNANPSPRNIFLYTTLGDRALSSSCQAGLVNNLIFGMSWGLFPLFFASNGLKVATIGFIKAFYPGIWGILQLVSGPLSDKIGRKWLIVFGQLIQAVALWLTVFYRTIPEWILSTGLLGLGTALVYPTLLAAVSDVADPTWRGAALGTYRFWRDMGYGAGAVFSGALADIFGIPSTIIVVGWLVLISSAVVAVRMYETAPRMRGEPKQLSSDR